ncbi:predicted protein [Sparassis crispa]|uniref:Uncharacterized protein n=1 Tax=Sparassis crispa TaxID=139825 RepID=A0A401H4I6_9APHY|nr:predicted protein [Sparassis crispa]GBE89311.1 predicted protein [Sparassis crispa]
MQIYGGYRLTEEQVKAWCHSQGTDPQPGTYIVVIMRYLTANHIQIDVLPCDYEGECIHLVVTDKKADYDATPDKYEQLQESDRARAIKQKVLDQGFDSADFVTVPDPYKVWQGW